MGFPGLPTDHVWYSLGRWGWANVDWCEATVAGYVTEPANTWSNLAYMMVGAFILIRRKHGQHPLIMILPWAMIALGFLSGFYHATNAWVTQLGDFIGMYLVAGIPFLLNLARLGMKKAATVTGYVVLNIVGAAVTVIGHYSGFPIQFLFAFFFGSIVVTEMLLMKNAPARSYSNFYFTLAAFAVAATFSALDVSRTMCDPHNHVIQGHALWHCFGAIGLYFAYRYCQDGQARAPMRAPGAVIDELN